MTYTILENGNYLVEILGADGLPMFIEMTVAQFEQIYGTAP
jgi:hypothetical protein